jgi:hypothetical protein
VQILPFIEENVIYDKLVQQAGTGNPPPRLGRLRDAAFAKANMAPTQNPGTPPHNTTNPLIYSTQLTVMVCPSYPGEEEVPVFGQIPNMPTGVKLGAGNYVALAATHYTRTPSNHLEPGMPTANNAKTSGKNCSTGAYCGNGGLPFPGLVGGQVQKAGLGFQSLSDGTSKVALITESREEVITSWYSGLASYVVAAWPQGDQPVGRLPAGVTAAQGAAVYWACPTTGGTCDHALNKGDTKGVRERYYQGQPQATPHGPPTDRIWGPSSRHPGVVIHGFADAHAEPVNESVTPEVYFAMATRAGREVDTGQ